jgi:hypothetical protein
MPHTRRANAHWLDTECTDAYLPGVSATHVLREAAMFDISISVSLAWTMTGLFGLSGVLHAAGPQFIRRAYERWDFPPDFHRVAAVVALLTAAFLIEPTTRVFGAILAAMVLVVMVVALLQNRQYGWSVLGILFLIVLIPASVSAFA